MSDDVSPLASVSKLWAIPARIETSVAAYIGGALLALMLVSIGVNIWLFKSREGFIGDLAAQKEQTKNERIVSQMCSDNTEKIKQASEERSNRAEQAMMRAEARARAAEARANTTLMLQPKYPNDMCASTRDLNAVKINARRSENGTTQ